jgi:RND superfamily putative drug exporter
MTLAPPRSLNHPPTGTDPGPVSVLGRLAALVLRHRRLVMVIWLVLLVLGGAAAGQVSKRLSFDFSLPGQPGYETASKIIGIWGDGGDQPPSILVVTAPEGKGISSQTQAVGSAFAAAARAEPTLRVVDYATTNDKAFLTNNGRSTFALVFTPPVNNFGSGQQVEAAQTILQDNLTGYQIGLTGLNQLSTGGDTKGPGVLVETIIGGLGALVVLGFVFASFLAFLPFLVAAVSITTTFLVVLGLTYMTEVSFIVEFLIALVGLGIAIDYSLLLVTRWREERARGADNHTAVITATETAGRAVFLSGLTVAIGLAALVVLPVPGLRSVGIGGMLIPLVSIFVVLTLLPALLGGVGPRIDWPRIRKEQTASRAWSAWGRGVIRWRWAAAGAAIILLAIFASPIFQLKVGETGVNSLAKSGSAFDAYESLISGGVQQGVLSPIEVLTTNAAAPDARSAIANLPGITSAALPTGSAGSRNGLTDIVVIPEYATLNNTTLAPVREVQGALAHMPGVVGVTGLGAIEQDYSHAVFGNFPLMFALIAVVTFLLLARAFRSLLLAGKAIVLNLLSLAATFGLMTWFWQEGHGSSAIFGIPATGAITFWVPLMIFAFLFGLSMDYEVFILTRVREEYDKTGSTNTAMTEGLGRTGRLVTSAALILFLAFASLASAPDTDVKVLATGLGAGILLDATVVRAILVPALVSLFGKWNWWFPRSVARALVVRGDVTH